MLALRAARHVESAERWKASLACIPITAKLCSVEASSMLSVRPIASVTSLVQGAIRAATREGSASVRSRTRCDISTTSCSSASVACTPIRGWEANFSTSAAAEDAES